MENKLGTKNVRSLLWELMVPAIIGMLSSAIYNIVDRIFVGRIDSLALTGVGITMPIQVLQMAFVLLIGIGSSTMISIKLGEKNKEDAEGILYTALKYILITIGLFTVVSIIFIEPLFNILSISAEAAPYARDYITIILWGGIIGLPGYCLNNSLRSIGYGKTSMKIVLTSSIINIILDPILIFGFGMGIKGAAIATVISQFYVTVLVLRLFILGKDMPIRLKKYHTGRDKDYVPMIIKNGSPSFYLQIFATLVGVITNKAIIDIGSDIALASITIMSSLFSFYHMIVAGITQGNQPICGYNYGAKQYDRVYQSLKLSLIFTFVSSVAFWLIIMLFPRLLSSIFTTDQALIESTSQAMRLYLLMLPAAGLHIVCSQYFQAVERPVLSTVLSLLRYGIILVPSIYIFGTLFGISGVYLSNAISDGLSFLIAMFFIAKELKRLKGLSIPN